MSEHKLKKGINFIEGLLELGEILGYHSKTEFPVEEGNNQSPAVDVAWLKEENQKFPLFIFEIESISTNSMVFNPMKVFTEKNEIFEKPLFFFQIILKHGLNSSRVEALKKQYGTYNYRIYRMASDEKQNLLNDIVQQHRRITDKIDLIQLIQFIKKTSWLEINFEQFVKLILTLDFEKQNGGILRQLAFLSAEFDDLTSITTNYIKQIHFAPHINHSKINYDIYIGYEWCYPIHLGIIYNHSTDIEPKNKAQKQLIHWQEKSSYMPMISPHFGLSADHDEFLIWCVGGLLGIVASLFNDNEEIRIYLSQILKEIIEQTKLEYKIPNLIWLHHILPKNGKKSPVHEFLEDTLNNYGNFSIKSFAEPLFFESNYEYIEEFKNGKDEYKDLIHIKNNTEKPNPINLAFFLMTTEVYDESRIGKEIISILN
ncbi:MAG: hypothetical protein ACI86H_002883 [bacterium]|jgi:hypothetical protein